MSMTRPPPRSSRLAQHAIANRGAWPTLPGITTPAIPREADEWLTPRWLLDELGRFDLDPCAHPSWPIAHRHYYADDDGLERRWRGRVWLNPPYSHTAAWLGRLVAHGAGTALVPARPETGWFRRLVWAEATAVLLLARRPQFLRASTGLVETTGYGASALVAYGELDAAILADSSLAGALLDHWQHRP